MKYIKMLGLAAVAAAALMAFLGASTASATVLCKTTSTPCNSKVAVGTELDFSLESGTSAKLTETGGGTLDTCTSSTVKGKVTQEGNAETTVIGDIEKVTNLTWGSCTFPTTTVTPGKLEIHHITGSHDGTLTAASEIGVTINTVFFGSCVYGVKAGTDLGRLTGHKVAVTGQATFDAEAVATKLSGSAFACPETSKWVASYVNTAPEGTLGVEPS